MAAVRKVTVIPAVETFGTVENNSTQRLKRVAAYARVSTEYEKQLSSYEAQVDYYTRYIKSNSQWQFVDIYADEAITGTQTKKREDFQRLIKIFYLRSIFLS